MKKNSDFPEEGCCLEINDELVIFLASREDQINFPEPYQSKYKGIAWNRKSSWYFVRSSSKYEFTMDYLKKYFQKEPIFNIF